MTDKSRTVRTIERFLALGLVGALAVSLVMAWPDLSVSLKRSKQKRTMATIWRWAGALEWSAQRHSSSQTSIVALAPNAYFRSFRDLKPLDEWGHPLEIAVSGTHYSIISRGRDGKVDSQLSEVTTNWDCDMIYADGAFVEFPDGL